MLQVDNTDFAKELLRELELQSQRGLYDEVIFITNRSFVSCGLDMDNFTYINPIMLKVCTGKEEVYINLNNLDKVRCGNV